MSAPSPQTPRLAGRDWRRSVVWGETLRSACFSGKKKKKKPFRFFFVAFPEQASWRGSAAQFYKVLPSKVVSYDIVRVSFLVDWGEISKLRAAAHSAHPHPRGLDLCAQLEEHRRDKESNRVETVKC